MQGKKMRYFNILRHSADKAVQRCEDIAVGGCALAAGGARYRAPGISILSVVIPRESGGPSIR
jgi:hypothetical protein